MISGLPVGFGEPWFEGIEPALAEVSWQFQRLERLSLAEALRLAL